MSNNPDRQGIIVPTVAFTLASAPVLIMAAALVYLFLTAPAA